MSTFTNLLFHIVYSTKYRKPVIEKSWQDDLYGYTGGIIRDHKGTLLCMGGVMDHVHLLAKLPPTIAVSDMLRLIKSNSSKMVNETIKPRTPFEWQPGYAAFSVSESQFERVRDFEHNAALLVFSAISWLVSEHTTWLASGDMDKPVGRLIFQMSSMVILVFFMSMIGFNL